VRREIQKFCDSIYSIDVFQHTNSPMGDNEKLNTNFISVFQQSM